MVDGRNPNPKVKCSSNNAAGQREQSFETPFPLAPYPNPVNNTVTGGFLHGTPQGALSNTSLPRHPPKNHRRHHPHTVVSADQKPSPIQPWKLQHGSVTSVTDECHAGDSRRLRRFHGRSGLHEPSWAPSPQAGCSNFFPIQRRRAQSLPCLGAAHRLLLMLKI